MTGKRIDHGNQMKLNRRSLFAGLAGLLAGKQVAQALPVQRIPFVATGGLLEAKVSQSSLQTAQFASSIRPCIMFASVASAPAGQAGDWGYCTGDFSLYAWRRGQWEPFAPSSAVIANGAIRSEHIAS